MYKTVGKVKIIIIFNGTKLRIYLYLGGLPVGSAYFEILPEHKFQFQGPGSRFVVFATVRSEERWRGILPL